MSVQRYDVVTIRARRTDEGFIEDSPVLTRTGIFTYRDPSTGRQRREYRPPEEVFHADSLASYRGKPITVGHPGIVHSRNVRTHGAGTLLSPGRQDGDNVVADVVIHDPAAIDAGHKDLSMGYRVDLDETPGTINGEPYDAIQRAIRVNHCAIVKTGRAGNSRLNLDEADFNTEQEALLADERLVELRLDGIAYKASPEVQVALDKLRADLAAATARADAAQAAADTHKAAFDTAVVKAATDAEKLRADGMTQARARLDLEAQAKTLKVEFKADTADSEIKAKVIKAVRGDKFDLTDKSEAYVDAAYDMAVAEGLSQRGDSEANKRRAMGLPAQARQDDDKPDPKSMSGAEARKAYLARRYDNEGSAA